MQKIIRISTTEFQKNVDHFQDLACSQTIIVTNADTDLVVIMNIDKYNRLQKRNREVLYTEDFSEAIVEAVRRTEPSKASDAFNYELKL